MAITNNSMTIFQGIDLVTNQPNEVLITFINKNLPWINIKSVMGGFLDVCIISPAFVYYGLVYLSCFVVVWLVVF